MARLLAAILLALLSIGAAATAGNHGDERASEWNFRVYLDDAEVGFHRFSLVEEGDVQRLRTVADFQVKFLFFTAFRYEHVNAETWSGECLESIESRTFANGKEFAVVGQREEDGFAVEASTGAREMGDCVKSFAYWNPDILDEQALLNSQTGELLPVSIEPVSEETLTVRGQEMPATRYRLEAKNMALDIWYSQDRQWVALESTVKGGRKLRYELT